MRPRVLDTLAVLALLALVAVGAQTWKRRVDPRATSHYKNELRRLLAVGMRQTGEVMKARSGIVGHYDGLVQTEATMRRALKRLRDVPAFLPEETALTLLARLDAVERAHARWAELVDQFKRKNSVLRNSVRYLPTLATEIDERMSRAGPAATAFDQTLNTLVRNQLLLQGWDESTMVGRVARAIEDLDTQLRAAPEQNTDATRLALAHARQIQALTPEVNELTRSIIALPTVERIQELAASFERHHQLALAHADRDALVCFALLLLVLALVAASVITRMRHSQDALQKTGAELEAAIVSLKEEQEKQKELGELKSRFVSMTSHQFRTPLSVIMSSSEMLEAYAERWPAEKKAEHFERIRTSALGMTQMLDDILMIGRSDAGMLQYEPGEVDISSLCQEVVAAVGDATGQGERIEYDGLNGNPNEVLDGSLLRHVLENLLSNAIKYSTAPSPVRFSVRRCEHSVVFTVSDRGIGISQEDQGRLFEIFHRGSNVGRVAGSGLGMAIVKRAVDLHRGQLDVKSQLGEGTSFSVTIPTDRGSP